MSEKKFFVCEHCGNQAVLIKDAGVPMVCCGEKMKELVANTVDASFEKHIPVIDVQSGVITAKVGSVEHPMVEEHFIEWIYLHTKQGGQMKTMAPGEKPEVQFALAGGDEPIAVYAYCNLHGLWKSEIK